MTGGWACLRVTQRSPTFDHGGHLNGVAMMELAAIYKQRSVECERRAAEAKEGPDKEAWRARAADFRMLAVEVSEGASRQSLH